MYYNQSLEDPYDITKHDQFDFQHVKLIPNEITYVKDLELNYVKLPVHKLLSGFRDQIESFNIKEGDYKIIYTKYFEINIEKAIASKEVKILEERKENADTEINLIEKLLDVQEGFTIGVLSYQELMDELEFQYKYYFAVQQIKWEIRYNPPFFKGGIGGL